jgi:rubrerythrin
MDFEQSKTRENLMRAFAGESQARNRYTFAAQFARQKQLEVVARVFEFTADQEKAHAKVFYDALEPSTCRNITVDGNYPIDIYPGVMGYLKAANHNELQEWEHDYAGFAKVADEEGFELISKTFEMIAGIEKTHADRFQTFAQLMERDQLFSSDQEEVWMCLNCGQIIHSTMAPAQCPVCKHGQDFYIRLSMAPFVG